MDECRIGWGKIVKFPISNFSFDKLRIPSRVEGQFPIKSKPPKINVKAKQLTINNQQLSISKPTVRELKIDYKGKQFIQSLNVGDWVSFHWGFVCDVLTEQQVKNLEFYTGKAIEFYNQT